MLVNCGRTITTYKLDQLNSHPVVPAFDQEIKQPRCKWQEVLRPSPTQFADDIYNSRCHAGILVFVQQTLLNFRPRRSQRLWVHKGKAIQGDDRLLADLGARMGQT